MGDAACVVAPAWSRFTQHVLAERVVAMAELEGRVGMEALEARRVAVRRDRRSAPVELGMRGVRAGGRGAQWLAGRQHRFISADPSRRFQPVDLPHQVGAREVARGREWPSIPIVSRLPGHCRVAVRATRRHADRCARLAPDLGRDDPAIDVAHPRLAVEPAYVLVLVRHVRDHSRTMDALDDTDTAVSYARSRWEDGAARIDRWSGDSRRRATLERVVEAILAELERRIGQTFTTRELADMYDSSEAWCLETAHAVAPEDPGAWELDTIQGAAFYRYARGASDYQQV